MQFADTRHLLAWFRPQRQASKSARAKRRPQVEVELTAAVDKLGLPGQRVQVAPGRMRNHLYPSKMALYVLGGRTLQLDGTLRDPASSSQASSTPRSSSASASSPVISSREILDQIDKLGPLRFERRTTKENIIHGSVTAQTVLSELQARGVPLTALEGDWQAPADTQDATEHGRVKKLGQYICGLAITYFSDPDHDWY